MIEGVVFDQFTRPLYDCSYFVGGPQDGKRLGTPSSFALEMHFQEIPALIPFPVSVLDGQFETFAMPEPLIHVYIGHKLTPAEQREFQANALYVYAGRRS